MVRSLRLSPSHRSGRSSVARRTLPIIPERERVRVALGDRSYDIIVGAGCLADLGACMRQTGLRGKAMIVTDRTVAKLYGDVVMRSLSSADFNVHIIELSPGERAKSLQWTSRVLNALAQARMERESPIVALGGGVVGDLAGFAAAIYLRGLPFVQVPTTLVAQVDSSVGGKTGINHAAGKNLVGAFHQPRLVLIDPLTLRTLPGRQWRSGLAEVIKYGMIADAHFFEYVERHLDDLLAMKDEAVRHVVRRSCEIKASVVTADERESGYRRILNYGHTVGHALELLGKYRTWLHGEAVAMGMVGEAELACDMGMCDRDILRRQRQVIRQAGLPHGLPALPAARVWQAMLHDKKVAHGEVWCVLPERVGQVTIAPVSRARFIASVRRTRTWDDA